MIVEERIYTVKSGKMKDYVALYKEKALPLQMKYLERLLGAYTSDIGDLNLYVHLWAYDDLADRQRRRSAMQADPAWPLFADQAGPMLLTMKNRIMLPTAYSPVR